MSTDGSQAKREGPHRYVALSVMPPSARCPAAGFPCVCPTQPQMLLLKQKARWLTCVVCPCEVRTDWVVSVSGACGLQLYLSWIPKIPQEGYRAHMSVSPITSQLGCKDVKNLWVTVGLDAV